MLIPVNLVNISGGGRPFRYYTINFQGEKRNIRIVPNAGYYIVTGLKPGNKKANLLISYHKKNVRTRKYKMDINFQLRPGHITIFPSLFEIRVENAKRTKSYRFEQRHSFITMGSNDFDAIADDIKTIKNFEKWKLMPF